MKKVLKNFLGFSLGPIIGYLISLALIPITTRLLSPDQFGMANMFTLLFDILTLAVIVGLDQAFMRFYHEEEKNTLFFNCVFISTFISLIVMIFMLIFRKNLSLLLFGSYGYEIPIIALAFLNPIFIIEKFLLLSVRMNEKSFQYSFWNIFTKLCNFCITILFLLFYKRNFESIVFATLLSQTLTSLVMFLVYFHNFQFKKIDLSLVKKLLKFGFPLLFSTLIGWGLNSIDTIFLRIYTTYTEIGYYSVAMKIANTATILQLTFTTYWAAIAFKWHANQKSEKYFEAVSKTVTFVMACILVLIFIVKPIIPFILGNEYEPAIYIFPFLLFYPIFYTISETITVGIAFSKKTYFNILVSIISLIANIILNCIFVPLLGAKGAAIATGMSYLVFFITRALFSRKLWYKFPISHFVYTSIIVFIFTLINTFSKNFVFISLIGILILIILTIAFLYELTTLFHRPGMVKIGLIANNTQMFQLKDLLNINPHVLVEIVDSGEQLSKFQRIVCFLKQILDKDVIYFGFGMTKFSEKLYLCKLLHKKVILHWIGTDVINAKTDKYTHFNQHFVDLNFSCSSRIHDELEDFHIQSVVVPIIPSNMDYSLSKVPKKHGILFYLPTNREKFYGIDYLYSLAHNYRDIHFYVVGNESILFKEKNIHNLGRLTLEEMDKLYDKISVLVRIPEHDGLSIMLLEALMRGKFVLYCYDFPYAMQVENIEQANKIFKEIVSKPPTINDGSREYVLRTYQLQEIQKIVYQSFQKYKIIRNEEVL